MRWATETREDKNRRLSKWRKWFAWYPVKIENERVWLEYVYRRTTVYYGGMGDCIYETEYADTMSMLKKKTSIEEWDGLE